MSHLTSKDKNEARMAAMAVNEILDSRFMLRLVATLPSNTADDVAAVLEPNSLLRALSSRELTPVEKSVVIAAFERSRHLVLDLSDVPEDLRRWYLVGPRLNTVLARGGEYWCYLGSWDSQSGLWISSSFQGYGIDTRPGDLVGRDIMSHAVGFCASTLTIAESEGTVGQMLEMTKPAKAGERGKSLFPRRLLKRFFLAPETTVRVRAIKPWSRKVSSVDLYWVHVRIGKPQSVPNREPPAGRQPTRRPGHRRPTGSTSSDGRMPFRVLRPSKLVLLVAELVHDLPAGIAELEPSTSSCRPTTGFKI